MEVTEGVKGEARGGPAGRAAAVGEVQNGQKQVAVANRSSLKSAPVPQDTGRSKGHISKAAFSLPRQELKGGAVRDHARVCSSLSGPGVGDVVPRLQPSQARAEALSRKGLRGARV